jgi:hypothetical protein
LSDVAGRLVAIAEAVKLRCKAYAAAEPLTHEDLVALLTGTQPGGLGLQADLADAVADEIFNRYRGRIIL